MKKVILTAAFAVSLSSGTALAADMTPPAAYDWTGAYIGLNGGLAFGHMNYKVKETGNFSGAISDSYTDIGYALGAGVEYAFDDAWSLKAEYMYVNLGSKKLGDPGFRTKATPDFSLVRLGINY